MFLGFYRITITQFIIIINHQLLRCLSLGADQCHVRVCGVQAEAAEGGVNVEAVRLDKLPEGVQEEGEVLCPEVGAQVREVGKDLLNDLRRDGLTGARRVLEAPSENLDEEG